MTKLVIPNGDNTQNLKLKQLKNKNPNKTQKSTCDYTKKKLSATKPFFINRKLKIANCDETINLQM